ncbi:Ig-like domain-containing protein [Limnohabitans planktonicus]|uniref:Ig-like domain-containing protein n=1 Tax=Limnohabitans planktonicus TaxID=540060 RepID=UPI00197B65D0|nr:Ig-like domain-containing protein [Limnohabitans planktonicus]
MQVRATDAAGNVATSAPLSFTLDTQTPAFTVALVCDSGASGADSISKSSALVVTGAETGATVEYSSNGTVWASTYAATEGANSVQVRVTDTAGNQRAQSFSFTLDSTAPTAPVLTLVCDSGSNATDKLSGNGAISVAAEAGATLEFSTNGSTWASTFAAAEGANTVMARVTDAAGNISQPSSLSFTLDSTAPVAPTVGLFCDSGTATGAATDKVSNNGTLSLSSPEAGGLIEYSTNGVLWATTFVAAEGNNAVKVRVTDAAGNLGATADYSFTLDTTAPGSPVLTLTCDSGASATDLISSDGALSVTAEAGATLQYSTDGTSWASTFAAAEGNNTVKVRAVDAAGNTGPASNLGFTLDKTIATPTLTLVCDSGTSASDAITRNGAISVSAEAGAKLEYSTNGTSWATTFAAVEGANTVTVRATDAAGNVASSAPLSFSLNTQVAAFTAKLDDASNSASTADLLTSDSTPTISGTGTAGNTIQVTLPGTGEVLSATVAANGSWSVTPTLAIVSGNVSITASDAAGNVSSAQTLALAVDSSIATPTLSLVCDSGASSTDKISRDGTISVSADSGSVLEYSTNGTSWTTTFVAAEGANTVQVRATDAAGNVATSAPLSFTLDTQTTAFTVALVCDSGASGADSISKSSALVVTGAETGATVEYSSNGTVRASTYAATEGANSVQVRVTDTAGNQRAQSFSFTLDSTAPTAPVLTLVCDSGSNATDKLSGNGAINVAAEAGATLEFSTNGSTWASTFAAAEGANTVMARVTDAAGNVSQPSSLSFTLDSTAPVAPTVGLFCDSGTATGTATDKISNNGTLSLSSPEAGGLIEYSTNGVLWATTFVAAEGNNAVKVRVSDAAGNVGATADYSFTLDTTAPGAPVLTLTCDSGSSAIDLISSNGALSVTAEAGATLQYSTDGTSWASTFAAAEGNNTVKVRAVDAAGNTGPASNLGFTLDKTITPPTLTLVCDSGTSASDAITRNGAISVNAEAGAKLEYSTNGTSWTATFAAVEGANTVTVRATDAAGNVASSAPLSFSLNTQVAAFTAKLDDASNSGSTADLLTSDSTPTISGTGTAGNTIQVTMPGTGEVLSATVAANGSWSVTPTLAIVSGNVSITASDAAGNVSSAQTLALVVDSTIATPTLSLVCDSGASSTDKISRDGTISVSAEAGATLEYSTNGTSWTSTFAAAEGANTVSVRATDAAGNVATSAPLSFSFDTTAATPTVSLSPITGDDALGPVDAASVRTLLSGKSTLTQAGDVVTLGLNGQTYSGTVDVFGNYSIDVLTADLLSDADRSVDVRVNGVDAAGNSGSTTVAHAYSLDTTVPTVLSVLLDKPSLKAGETAQVTLTFSEKVTAFDLADLSADNAVLSQLASADGSLTWTATLTPTAAIEDTTNVVKVLATYTDLAGNTGLTAQSSNYSLDTLAPSFTLQLDNASNSGSLGDTLTNDSTPTLSGTGNTGDTLKVTMPATGEVVSATVAADGTWRATLTQAITSGTVSVIATDAVGNTSAAQTLSLQIDTSLPGNLSLALVCDSGTSSSDKITRTGDVTVTGQDADTTVQYSTDGSTWATIFAATEGLNTLRVRQMDAAGNVSATSTLAFTLDTTAPVPTLSINPITGDDAIGPVDAASTTTKISGTSTGARPGDVITLVLNGVSYTGTVDVVGEYSIDVATADLSADSDFKLSAQLLATDAAGNSAAATASRSYSVDALAPTVQSIVLDKSTLKLGETANVTLTFSEKVSAFDLSDLSADNGVLSNLVTTDGGLSWSAKLTPTASIEDTTNVVKVLATYTDLAGNTGAAAQSNNYALDTLAPAAIIKLANENLKAGDSTTLTISFNEPVQGFGNSDVTVANGSLGTLTSADGGKTWTATYTPTANITSASNLITLANSYTDALGNPGEAGTSGNYQIDTQLPSATLTLTGSNGAAVNSFTAGQSATVTLSFSETVKDFSNADVSVDSGSLSPLSSSDGGKTWVGTFTAAANVEDATNTLSVNAAGYSDLAGNAGGVVASSNYAVDTQGPTTTIALSKSNFLAADTAQVTITFSEKVTGFDNSDVTVDNGTLSALSSTDGGKTWVGTFTPTPGVADATNTVSLMNSYTDVAGNQGTSAQSANYVMDLKAPSATIALSDSALKMGETATVTITFSEKVLGFSLADVSAPNGSLSAFTASADGLSWTATFTPADQTTAASNTLTLANTYSDEAGNAGQAATASYGVSTKGPSFTLALDAASNSGSSADLITNDDTPTISGTGTAGVTIQVTMPGTFEVLSTTVAANGSWSITPTLAIVSGTMSALATDAFGNSSTAKTLALVIDKTMGAASVALLCDSGLSATDKISRDGTLSVSADSGSTLEYSSNGSTWATTFAAAEGANTVQVRATDAAGNVATSAPLSFTLDTQTPAFSVALLCDSGTSSADKISLDASLQVSGAEAGALVEYSTDGAVWKNTYAATEGANSVQVRVTDAAGNQRAQSFSFTLDSTAPTAPVISLVQDSGTSSSDGKTQVGVVNASTEAGATLQYSTNGSVWGTTFAAVEGINNVFARASDKAGHVSPIGNLSFTLDTSAPTAPVVALLCDSGSSATDKLSNTSTLNVTTSESGGLIEYSTNGSTWSGTFSASEGLNTLKVRVSDAAGNVSAATDFSFTLDTTVPSAPGMSLVCDSGTSASDKITREGTLSLSTLEQGASFQYSTDGKVWANTWAASEGSNAVQTRVVDAAGNVSAASTLNFTLDKTLSKPVVSLVCDTGTPIDLITTNGAITLTQTDPDATVLYSRDGISWSTTFAAVEGSNTVFAQVSDAAGNLASSDALVFTLNTQAGTFTARLDNASNSGSLKDNLTNDDTPTISGSGETGATVQVTLPAPVDGGSAEVLQATVDINGMWSVTAGKAVTSGEVSVLYTRPNSGATSTATFNLVMDKSVSTLSPSLTCDSGTSTSDKVSSQGTLVVSGVDADASVQYSTDGSTWGTTFVATEGVNSVRVRQTDGAGNVSAISTLNFTLDTTAPTPTLSINPITGDDAVGPADAANATSKISGATTNARQGDLIQVVLNGVNYSTTVDTVGQYSLDVATTDLTTDPDATVALRLVASDLAGNTATVQASRSYSVDTSVPTVQSIVLDKSSLKVGETATLSISFSEKVTGFDLSDLSAENAVLSGLNTSDGGKTWTATLTPTAGIEDTSNVVRLLATYTDVAGNTGTAAQTANYQLDTLATTATIKLGNESLKAGDSTVVTISFNEVVQGFGNADVQVVNGSLGTLTSADGGKTWTATYTPNVNVESTTNVISLASSYSDAAGNTGTAGASGNYQIDTQAASATITLKDSHGAAVNSFTAGQSATVTITFSEAVKDFSNADVTTQSGDLSPLSSSDGGKTWIGMFTAAQGVERSTNTISVNGGTYADLAGNVGGVAASANYALDTQGPTATVVLNKTRLLAGDTAQVTISFSEKVSGFGNSDVTVENGTLDTLVSTDGGKTWVATFTPTPGTADASNVISLANSYADLAGNQGSGTQSGNYAIDLKAPTATIALSDSALKSGETATVSITFSEKVLDFSKTDVTAPHGSLTEFVASADGLTWTATFTPQANTSAASNLISLAGSYTDESGNSGAGASASYAIDTQAPVFTVRLDDSSNTGNLSDNLSNDDTPTVSGNGTAGDIIQVSFPGTGEFMSTTVGANGTWSVTPTQSIASGNVTVVAIDSAGNTSPAQTLALVIDKSIASPTVAMASDTGSSGSDKVSSVGALSVSAESGTLLEYSTDSGQTWFTTFTAGEGANTVTVRATDGAGNVATSNTLNFTLDSQMASFSVALMCDSGTNSADKISQDGRLSLSGIETGATVEFSTNFGTAGTSWSNTFSATEGNNSIKIRVTDAAGNQRLQDYGFTFDSTSASAPVLALANDTGASSNDRTTHESLINVSAEAGSLLEYSSNGIVWGPTFVATEGVNSVFARITDKAGNVSPAGSLTFTLDTTAPVAPTVSLVCDSGVSGTDRLTANPGFMVSSAEISGVVEYSTNGSSWSTTFTAVEGSNSIKVRVTDTAGNIGAATDFSFTLDSTGPDTSALALVCDTGSSGTDKITSQAALSISTIESGLVLQYSTNGAQWGTTFAAGEGSNTVYTRAVDAAGNAGTPSSLSFTLDTQLSKPSLALVCDSGSQGDNISSQASIQTFNLDADARIEYSTNGTLWNATFAPVQGANTVMARVTDTAGNVNVSEPLVFTFDTVAPSPSIALSCDSGTSASDFYTRDKSITTTGVLPTDQVSYSSDAGLTWSNTFFAVDGLNKVTIRVLDGAGNVGTSNTLQFTLDTQLLETPISLTCDSGISGTDRISSLSDITVGSAEIGATLSYRVSLADQTLVRDWASSYLPPSSNGDYVVEVRTTDKAGNTSVSALDFTLINTPPAVGTLSLVTDSGRSASYTSDRITNVGQVRSSVTYGVGYTVLYQYSTDAGNSWSVLKPTFSPVMDGTYQVRQVVSDAVANTATTSPLVFTLDTTAPAAPNVTLVCDAGTPADLLTNDGRIAVSGSENLALIQYSTDSGNTWTSTFAARDGTNDVWVRQMDFTGNTSAVSALNFTLDTSGVPPALNLFCDSGSSVSDSLTNDVRVFVDNLEAGGTVEYNLDNAGWISSYTAPTVDGVYNLKIRARDSFGNVSPVVSRTFTLDTTPATVSNIYSTSIQYTTGATLGNTIDILMDLSEPVQTGSFVVVNLNTGAQVTLTALANGSQLSGSYVVGAGESTTDLTVDTFQNVRLTDLAGNTTSDAQVPIGTNLGDNNAIAIRWALNGTDGNDLISGISRGLGIDDDIFGKLGNDTISYEGITTAVNVNLNTGLATGTDAAVISDKIDGFENIITGSGADTLVGTAGANVFDGGAGTDSMVLGDGSDTVINSAGADTIDAGEGSDWIDFSQGTTAGLSGTLNGATAANITDGTGATDVISNMENMVGTSFADTLTGDLNANILIGGNGSDSFAGGAGNDSLQGDEGDDTLTGGLGDDTLYGGAGSDRMDGTAGGQDWADFSRDAGAVQVNLSVTLATDFSGGTDTITNIPNVLGTSFNDVMQGDAAANMLSGGDGADSLYGFGGNDTLMAGLGDDTLLGFGGANLQGGDGSDWASYGHITAISGVQVDLSAGRATLAIGTDSLSGIENLFGTTFNDRLGGDANANSIIGGGGNDTLLAGGGNDTVFMIGQDSTALVDAGTGDDVLTVSGQGILLAGDGDDLVSLLDIGTDFTGTTIQGGSGIDTLSLASAYGTVFDLSQASAQVDAPRELGAISGIEVIDMGSGLNQLIMGSDSLNIDRITGLVGQASLLRVDGTNGKAYLPDGFGGIDVNKDGLADTTVIGGNTYRLYSNSVVGGNDTMALQQGISVIYTTVLTEATDPLWIGTDEADRVNGRAGNETLDSAKGDDTLIGGSGNDSLNGGAGLDWAEYTANNGDPSTGVTVNMLAGTTSGAAGNDTLVNIENVLGSAGSDSLVGNVTANWLMGAGGNDTLFGDSGDDTLTGGSGADSISGGAGNDWADYSTNVSGIRVTLNSTVGANTTVSAGTDGPDTLNGIENIAGGSGSDTILGDSINNFLMGNAGNDVLSAVNGSDTLVGGSGNDSMHGGTGSVLFYLESGNDTYSGGDAVAGTNDTLDMSAYKGTVSAIGRSGTGSVDFSLVTDAFNGTDFVTQMDVLRFGNGNVVYNPYSNYPTSSVGNNLNWAETVITGNGNDSIWTGLGGDSVFAGAGNDTVNPGGLGNNSNNQDRDTVDGGEGNDWISYFGATEAVAVSLNAASTTFQAVTVAAQSNYNTDFIRGFENILTGSAADTVWGTLADERFMTGAGADYVYAGDGNNWVDSGSDTGNDRLFAGLGNDTIYTGLGTDLVSITGGNNFVSVSSGGFADTVVSGSGDDTIYGSYGLNGSTANDTEPVNRNSYVNAGDGNNVVVTGQLYIYNGDRVITGSGNDFIDAGKSDSADDTVISGAGNDTVYLGGSYGTSQQADLGDGNDIVFALTGADSLVAGAGHDTVDAGNGNNTISGGAGNDSISAGTGADRIDAGTDNDWVSVGDGANTVVAGTGNDTIITGVGNDYIDAGTDNDWVNAGGGTNSVLAGDGNDYILVNSASTNSTLWGGLGNDTINSSGSNNSLVGGDGEDRITQTGLYAGSIHGGAGNDIILSTGSTGAETVWGGYGDDFIDLRNGGTTSGDRVWGDDTINDTIAGNDTIYMSDASSTVSAGAGSDWVLSGLGNDSMLLGTGNDTAYGAGGNDTMDGGTGADWMDAGGGNDSLQGGSTDDGLDTLYGGAGNDFISGGAGGDWMDGSAGDDTLIGGEGTVGSVVGNDTIIIGAGSNIARGELGSDVFVYDNSWMNDTSADTIDGGAGVDIIKFEGAGLALDLSLTGTNNWVNMERIDLTGTGNNTLRLAREDIVELSDVTDVTNANLNSRARLVIDGNAGDALDMSVLNATTTKVTSGTMSFDFNGNGVLDASETATVNANGLITMESLLNGQQTYTVYNVSNTAAGTTTNYGLLILDTDILLTGV